MDDVVYLWTDVGEGFALARLVGSAITSESKFDLWEAPAAGSGT